MVVCVVAALSYLAPKLEGALISNPQTVWPLWPGCAILVSALLLVPLRIWPILIPLSFAGFVLYDLQVGVPVVSIAWFMLADTVQVLIAALGLRYSFDGVPQLNSIRALTKYSFFAVILAPFAAAFLSARGIPGDYWNGWRVCFFSEVLAFVTVTPAIFGWVSEGRAWLRKSHAYHLEAAALVAGMVLLGYLTFNASETSSLPALLYSLVPFLLWSALRFRVLGISTSVVVVAFLSIWGMVHGRGPFSEQGPLSSLLSLQLFLVFAATPFMVLAAVVEERKHAEEELRNSEVRFRLAAQAGKMYAYEWDAVMRSDEHVNILGYSDHAKQLNRRQLLARIHPDDRALFISSVEQLTPENPTIQISYRVVRPDGSVVWLEKGARAFFDEQGRMLRVVGMVVDITERKRAEEALASVSGRLIVAQEQERTRIARELHDDIGQRLALLAIELEQLQNSPDMSPDVFSRMGELQKDTVEIAADTQSLSHELHSSKLHHLGVAAAMRGFCKEFGEQHKVEINFKTHDLPDRLPPDISLCLFRVLQEALQNSAKHSGARHFEVQLCGTSHEIHLTIGDSGAGFDSKEAKQSRGLGLVSMEERLKLVRGTFSIDSELKRGTTIRARIPIDPEKDSKLAAS
jgi:PAS domain S-box-containing protein